MSIKAFTSASPCRMIHFLRVAAVIDVVGPHPGVAAGFVNMLGNLLRPFVRKLRRNRRIKQCDNQL